MLEKQDLEAIDELNRTRIEESEARTNKRFEAVDQRFEAMDKRFEAVDKRFEDLETRMDKRFEEMRGDIWKDVSVLMDAKFEKYFNLLAENQQVFNGIVCLGKNQKEKCFQASLKLKHIENGFESIKH